MVEITEEDAWVNATTDTRAPAWGKWGDYPWLDVGDISHINTHTSGALSGDYSFPTSSGNGTIYGVKLRFKDCIANELSENYVAVYVYDGSSWYEAGILAPTWLNFNYDTDLDVSTILNTWDKINAAQVYVRFGGFDNYDIDISECIRVVFYDPTLLTFNSKYVVTSTNSVTAFSATNPPPLVDDTETYVSGAPLTFTLAADKTVLIIYQANNVNGAAMPCNGMQNAIKIDAADVANSWDGSYNTNYCIRNTVFWVGKLVAGSHTVIGRFASNTASSTATISNRILLIYIFNGDAFGYVDSPTAATTTSITLVDDPNAALVVAPATAYKALVLYNAANFATADGLHGKKAGIKITTGTPQVSTDYSQAEKSGGSAPMDASVFTLYALSLAAGSTTVTGRFAMNYSGETAAINRRQLAVLLLDNSTDFNIITSDTQVSTTYNTLQDDTQAQINHTTTETRELLVVAMGTKRSVVTSNNFGECYGIMTYPGGTPTDRTNSRGSPMSQSWADSAATAWAEQLASGAQTVKGRFSNNSGTTNAIISSRRVAALWFTVSGLTKNISEAASESPAVSNIALPLTQAASESPFLSNVSLPLMQVAAESPFLSNVSLPLMQAGSQGFSYVATIPLTQASVESTFLSNVSVPLTQTSPQSFSYVATIPLTQTGSETSVSATQSLSQVSSAVFSYSATIPLTQTATESTFIANISIPLKQTSPQSFSYVVTIPLTQTSLESSVVSNVSVPLTQTSPQGFSYSATIPLSQVGSETSTPATQNITQASSQSFSYAATIPLIQASIMGFVVANISIPLKEVSSQSFSYSATIPLTQTSIQSLLMANVSLPLTQVSSQNFSYSITILLTQTASQLFSYSATIPLTQASTESSFTSNISVPLIQVSPQLFSYAATIPLTQTSMESTFIANIALPLIQVGQAQTIVSNVTVPLGEISSETLSAYISGLYVSLTETGLETSLVTNITFPLLQIAAETTAITNISFALVETGTETTQTGVVNLSQVGLGPQVIVSNITFTLTQASNEIGASATRNITQASVQAEQMTNVLVPLNQTSTENGLNATFLIMESSTEFVTPYLVGPVKVTKIFLVIGDLAIQLCGD